MCYQDLLGLVTLDTGRMQIPLALQHELLGTQLEVFAV